MSTSYNSPIAIKVAQTTDKEYVHGHVLTTDNIKVITARRSELANQLVNLNHDGDQTEYLKELYYLKGQIGMLSEMLALGADCEHKLINGAAFDDDGKFIDA